MKTLRHFLFFAASCVLAFHASAETKIMTRHHDNTIPKGGVFTIVFDEAVIASDKVGTSAEDVIVPSPAIDYSATWAAPNSITVTLNEAPAYKAQYKWSLTGNTTYQSGKKIPSKIGFTRGQSELYLNYNTYDGGSTSLGTRTQVYIMERGRLPLSPGMFDKVFFRSRGNNKNVKIEHISATLSNPSISNTPRIRYSSFLQYVNALREETPKNQWDKPITTMLVATPEQPLKPGLSYEIVLQEKAKDYTRYLGTVYPFGASLDYSPSDQDESSETRTMKLLFSPPAEIQDLKAFFNDLAIEVDGKDVPPTGEDGTRRLETESLNVAFELPEKVEPRESENLDAPPTNDYSVIPIIIRGDDVFHCDITVGNVKSADGQSLKPGGKKLSANIKMKSPTLFLDATNNGLINMGNRKLGFDFCNLDKLSFSTKRISPTHEFNAIYAYDSYYQQNGEGRKTTSEINKMRFVPFDLIDPNSDVVETVIPCGKKTPLLLSLDQIYGKKPSPGLYLIEVSGKVNDKVIEGYNKFGITNESTGNTREFNAKTADIAAQALIQLSDLGILWKVADNNIFIYSYSLANGKPTVSAKVEFADDKGKIIGGTSIKEGIAETGLPTGTKYIRVSTDDDTHIARIDSSYAGIDMWRFDVPTPSYLLGATGTSVASYEERRVFIYTDRNLYRPGEEFHLKGIARILKGNDVLMMAGQPAVLTLKGPQDNTLLTRNIEWSDYGTFDFSYTLPEEEVGTYSVSINFTKTDQPGQKPGDEDEDEDSSDYYKNRLDEENRTFRKNIEVQEFKRNAFEVKSSLAKPVPGDKSVTVSSSATNYTGVPLSGAEIEWTSRTLASNFYPKDYREYEFGDYTDYDSGYWRAYYGYGSYDRGNFRQNRIEGKLDEEGKLEKTIDLPEQSVPRCLSVNVTSRVTDGNEQSISSYAQTTVHPAEVYVGIKSSSHIHKTGNTLPVGLIAVGLDGKPFSSDVEVEITASRQEFRQNRYTDGSKTTVKNDSTQETEYSATATITSADSNNAEAGGKTVNIPAEKPGIYTIKAKGQDNQGNTFYSAVKVWVYGGDYSPWMYENDSQIKLVPDKPLYSTGDTAKILVQTPIEGDVIVTVEREKVLRSYTRHITLKDSVVEVPIEEGDAPNVYASVFLVKGAEESGREFKDPQLKIGYCALNVRPTEKILNISLASNGEKVLPGSTTIISGQVTDSGGKGVPNAEVTLYVEDEGTLDVVGYTTPNPITYFYDTRVLDVYTRTILNSILTEDMGKRSFDNKGVFIGGGHAPAALAYEDAADDDNQQNMLRKDFKPCAYWNPRLITDENGSFKVEYTNPDTLTRYRAMAVAADKTDKFGFGQTKYIVNKPVMLEPAPPVFASQGDELLIPVTISKTTDREGKWLVTIASEGNTSIDNEQQVVTIPSKGSTTTFFKVKFTNIGETKLTWNIRPANDNGEALSDPRFANLVDRVECSFNVEFPAPLLREDLQFTLSADGTREVAANSLLSKDLNSDATKLELALSTSPMVYVSGSMEFLLTYPHGCLEQKSSKLIPWIYADILARYVPNFPSFTEEKRQRVLSQGVGSILKHQSWNGEFGYWGAGQNSEFSPYAVLVLLLAKEQGADVPEQKLDSFWQRMSKQLSGTDKLQSEGCLLYWAAAKAGAIKETEFNKLIDKVKPSSLLEAYYFALAILESGRPDAKELAASIVSEGRNKKTISRWRDSNVDAVEMIYLTKLDPTSPETGKQFAKFVNKASRKSSFCNTWVSGWNTIAMGFYLSAQKGQSEPVAIKIRDGEESSDTILDARGTAFSHKTSVGNNAAVSLKEGQAGPAYGRLLASGKPMKMKFDAVANKGFVISRSYEKQDENGVWKPSNDFTVGDIVRVSIEAQGNNVDYEYVVIEDYLPSAFEAVNPELTSQAGGIPQGKLPRDYYWSSYVSNTSFLKNRVSFFMTSWRKQTSFRASYIARVTKAGYSAAPPAKAELMYEPQSYGLTTNQWLTVKPKPGNE